MFKKLVEGVGVNDADYTLHKYEIIDGRKVCVWRCPYYECWSGMLMRCYSVKYKSKRPTYNGCSVCDEWLVFSAFKKWMQSQLWFGNQLDKDIIVDGNKLYSPETCCFVSGKVNLFLTNTDKSKNGLPVGVVLPKGRCQYQAYCRDPFMNKCLFIGSFKSADDAHHAWRKKKHEFACRLADIQNDERVADALRNKFAERIRQEKK